MRTEMRKQNFKSNIEKIAELAHSTDYVEGEKWYRDARLFCYKVSKQYGLSFRKTCAILSALSPRNRWERNKIDCENLVAYLTGNTVNEPSCATYGAMVQKAVNIFHSKTDSIESMLKLLNGPKIKAFFLNIYDFNSDCVTVDSWIQLIALGEYLAVDKRPSLKKTDYVLIENLIKEIASTKKVKPPVMQAVLWIAFRNLTKQKDFN
jgi:hypothetical protein